MRQAQSRLRLDLAQYRSLAAFAQFGSSDLDAATRSQIERGQRMTEVLKQGQYQPMPVAEQIAILWAASNGYLDDVPVDRVREFEAQFLETLRTANSELLERILTERELSDEIVAGLKTAIENFKGGTNFSQPAAGVAAAAL